MLRRLKTEQEEREKERVREKKICYWQKEFQKKNIMQGRKNSSPSPRLPQCETERKVGVRIFKASQHSLQVYKPHETTLYCITSMKTLAEYLNLSYLCGVYLLSGLKLVMCKKRGYFTHWVIILSPSVFFHISRDG